jgi:hypothetical protein
MQARSDNFLPLDKILYSHQKALDETVTRGAIPRRLFRVLYPVRAMNVQGRQRIATDMEEIQWFMERAIHQADLTSAEDLEFFFGLDEKTIRAMLSFLEKIGHVQIASGGRLALTRLGEESVAQRISYQERDTEFKLYFDAFGNRPLRREHFRAKLYDSPPMTPGFWIFPPLFRNWDAEALTRLSQDKERNRYGLWDEVSSISAAVEDQILYLPVYIVERKVRVGETAELPVYLAFTTLPGYRDDELEQTINQDPLLVDWLESNSENLQTALDRRLEGFGLQPEHYRVEEDPTWGTKVFLDPAALTKAEGMSDQRITIAQIGRYMLAADWCFLLICEDPAVRQEAAIQDCLELLEYSHSDPSREEIDCSIALNNRRLDLQPGLTLPLLLAEAGQRGKNRAIERLERFS